jgi:hypothetical protein
MGWGVENVRVCTRPFFKIKTEVINVLLQFGKICLEVEIRIISKECHILGMFEEKKFGEILWELCLIFIFVWGRII